MDARMLAWTNPVLPSLDALLAVLRLVAQWGDGPAACGKAIKQA